MTHLAPLARLDLGNLSAFTLTGDRLYAYNGAGSTGRLVAVDISDVQAPRIEHALELRAPIAWVGSAGDKLVASEYGRALHVLDAATLAQVSMFPLLRRHACWSDGPLDRHVVALNGVGLVAFDLTAPGTPRVRDVLEIDGCVAAALRSDASTILVGAERGGLAIVDTEGALRERARLFRNTDGDGDGDDEPIAPRLLQRAGDTLVIYGWSDRIRSAPLAALEAPAFDGDVEDIDNPRLICSDGSLIVLGRAVATWAPGAAKLGARFLRMRADERYLEVSVHYDADQEMDVPDSDPPEDARPAERITFAQRRGNQLFALEDEHLVIYALPEGSLFRAATEDPTIT